MFAYRPRKLVLNQWKYVLDILIEVELLGCKPRASPIDSKPNFWDSTSPLLADVHAYRGLVGMLIYLTGTRPDITYTVGLLSQFMHAPQEIHCKLLFMFSPISSMLLDVVFSTYNTVIFMWRPTLTLATQAIVVIKNLFLGVAHSLAGTLSRGGVKNNTLSISPLLKLNIIL